MKNSVKERRKLLKMTQGKFVDLIGVSRQNINAIDKEKFDLSVHTAFKMSNQTALVLLGKFFIVVFFQAKIKTNNHHH